ncbi:MAG: DNA mismatch repair endonuclease MutL [Firmicutes bacterium]|nr:DNA mismatch repair endonuclease MutL [Bacillota bacterium]
MIRVLDKNVADKIAAGEVIDRPVSIVKELVENALDAGAGSITVSLRGGGKEYLRVTDDGCGIPWEDVELAFRRHATSKIEKEKDLDAIGTLGFRGEALASICAVSRVEMITKTAEEKTGRHLVVEGSEVLSNTAIGCPHGTTITVHDLFYNLPARRKFLGSDSAEGRRITDLLSRMALAYPDVKFRLISGKKDVIQTSGKGNILDNILRIYGRDLEKDLIPVDDRMNGWVVRGFVSSPGLSSASRNRQIFCVNGRIVSSGSMERGLEKAYKERLFTGRFPLAFLFLSVPPEILDVNVHPTKKEIRFDDPFQIEDFIEGAVRKALMGAQSVPRVDGERLAKATPAGEDLNTAGDEDAAGAVPGGQDSAGEAKDGLIAAAAVSSRADTDPFRRKDDPADARSGSGEQVDVKYVLETMRREAEPEEPAPKVAETGPAGRMRLDIPALRIIGIAFETYLITTDGESLYLIDQHAAHERIYYERFLRQYREEEKVRQAMLVPLQFPVSADVEAAEEDWIDYVRRMGYDIENFGERVYLVREIPAFLAEGEAEEFLRQFFIELEEHPDLSRFASLDRLIVRSCKSAVKAGDALHPEEADALLQQLFACGNPYSCPHGRPTIVKMSRRDLEKLFRRV